MSPNFNQSKYFSTKFDFSAIFTHFISPNTVLRIYLGSTAKRKAFVHTFNSLAFNVIVINPETQTGQL